MVNIYLFIELLGSADAAAILDTLKTIELTTASSPMW